MACGLPDTLSRTLCVSHADSKADIVHSSLLVSTSTGLHQQPNSPLPSGPCGSSWGCLGTVAQRTRGLRGVYLHLGFSDGCAISVSRGATVEPTLVAEPLRRLAWRSTASRRSATSCSTCPSTSSIASFEPFLQGSGRAGGSGAACVGTPAPDFGRGGTEDDRNVPAWDGCAVTLEAFREESELFCVSGKDRQLVLLRPRIAAHFGVDDW